MMARRGALLLTHFLLAVAISLGVDALPSAAQQPSAPTPPTFDVVSIKHGEAGMSCKFLQERLSCQASLLNLIKEAYRVEYFQIDAPKWIGDSNDSDHIFLLEATMPTGTTQETARLMLQQALADRFGLKIHWDKRDIPVYALIPGKHGVKLQSAKDQSNHQVSVTTPAGNTLKGSVIMQPGEFLAAGATLDFLALDLTYRADLDRPVVNMTGLRGEYDIDVHWTPTRQPNGIMTSEDPEFAIAACNQLGLQLEKRTVPFEILVVDYAESVPSAN